MSILTKICIVGAELINADRQTEEHREANGHFSRVYVTAPKKKSTEKLSLRNAINCRRVTRKSTANLGQIKLVQF